MFPYTTLFRSVEKKAQLAHELKGALRVRDEAEFQLKQQADAFERQLAQAREEAARELEKVTRQEKYHSERQQLDFEKTLRQRQDDFEHDLKQQEHELTVGFDVRLAEEKAKIEQDNRERRAELEARKEAFADREHNENSYQAALKNEAHAANTDLSQPRTPQLSESELDQVRQEGGAGE